MTKCVAFVVTMMGTQTMTSLNQMALWQEIVMTLGTAGRPKTMKMTREFQHIYLSVIWISSGYVFRYLTVGLFLTN